MVRTVGSEYRTVRRVAIGYVKNVEQNRLGGKSGKFSVGFQFGDIFFVYFVTLKGK